MKLTIQKLVSGGAGLAFDEKTAVFVEGALPGEIWEVEILDSKKGWKRARVLGRPESPHPLRVSPPCGLYDRCGGCDLQHLDHAGQVEAKTAMIRESFHRIGKLDVMDIHASPGAPWHYRSRIQVHWDGSQAGFREKRSDRSVPVAHCPVANPSLNRFLEQAATHLEDREPGRYVVYGGEEDWYLEGRHETARQVLADREFRFPLAGFFQSNPQETERLLALLRNRWGRGTLAADLYAGVGVFARFLAEDFAGVLVVEENVLALDAARGHLADVPAEFFAESVESWIQGAGRNLQPEVLVADPPRTGLSETVRAYVAEASARDFFYVSCNVDTLARDLGDLCRRGWKLKEAHLLDFYPQTSHMEALAWLEHSP